MFIHGCNYIIGNKKTPEWRLVPGAFFFWLIFVDKLLAKFGAFGILDSTNGFDLTRFGGRKIWKMPCLGLFSFGLFLWISRLQSLLDLVL